MKQTFYELEKTVDEWVNVLEVKATQCADAWPIKIAINSGEYEFELNETMVKEMILALQRAVEHSRG